MTFITKVVKKFWKKNQSRRSNDALNLANIRSYNCQEMGHFANTCPKAKGESSYYKEQKKDKAMVAAWGESDSDSDVKEKRRACLVADDDEVSLSPKVLARQQLEIIINMQFKIDALENDVGNLKNENASLKEELVETDAACYKNRDLAYG